MNSHKNVVNPNPIEEPKIVLQLQVVSKIMHLVILLKF